MASITSLGGAFLASERSRSSIQMVRATYRSNEARGFFRVSCLDSTQVVFASLGKMMHTFPRHRKQ